MHDDDIVSFSILVGNSSRFIAQIDKKTSEVLKRYMRELLITSNIDIEEGLHTWVGVFLSPTDTPNLVIYKLNSEAGQIIHISIRKEQDI